MKQWANLSGTIFNEWTHVLNLDTISKLFSMEQIILLDIRNHLGPPVLMQSLLIPFFHWVKNVHHSYSIGPGILPNIHSDPYGDMSLLSAESIARWNMNNIRNFCRMLPEYSHSSQHVSESQFKRTEHASDKLIMQNLLFCLYLLWADF